MNTIRFTALGGAKEVGANSYLIVCDGHHILLDCGIHPKKEGSEALPNFSVLDRAPDALLITHGHVDHCGSAPYLMREFPTVVPYATGPTRSIMDRMLHNSVSVMETLAVERGIRGYPLFSHRDVDNVIRRTYGLALDTEFALKLDCPIRASFHHAGHVLGSASVLLRMPNHTLLYTGDVCTADQELMGGLVPPNHNTNVDTLVIECTYGANEYADSILYEEEVARFADDAATVLGRGGCVLVPSFALGRTQEMLNMIARLQTTNKIPTVPVYTSGLGLAVYEVYDKFQAYLRNDAVLRPSVQFRRVGDVWDRNVIRELLARPAIIVATAGMMIENTPSSLIAQEMVRHNKHGIFFVGYLDPDTLGYKLRHAQKGDKLQFELNGPPTTVVLETIRKFHFSSHAPRSALQKLIHRIKPKNVVFVHGDPEAVEWMYNNCSNGFEKFVPAPGAPISLKG